MDAPVERAPSIGPKTAARLDPLGIRTVGDLVEADPEEVAERLDDRRFSVGVVETWRDQARLLTQLPALKNGHAVLFVGLRLPRSGGDRFGRSGPSERAVDGDEPQPGDPTAPAQADPARPRQRQGHGRDRAHAGGGLTSGPGAAVPGLAVNSCLWCYSIRKLTSNI